MAVSVLSCNARVQALAMRYDRQVCRATRTDSYELQGRCVPALKALPLVAHLTLMYVS